MRGAQKRKKEFTRPMVKWWPWLKRQFSGCFPTQDLREASRAIARDFPQSQRKET